MARTLGSEKSKPSLAPFPLPLAALVELEEAFFTVVLALFAIFGDDLPSSCPIFLLITGHFIIFHVVKTRNLNHVLYSRCVVWIWFIWISDRAMQNSVFDFAKWVTDVT